VRRAQYAVVFPQWCRLSAAGLSRVDEANRPHRPVHLCCPRIQEPVAQEHRVWRDRFRSPGSGDLFHRRDVRCHDAVPTDALMSVKDRATRVRVLTVASRLFAANGFEKVTVREICRAADANVAAVNYHFGDKLGLYREVLAKAIETMSATT